MNYFVGCEKQSGLLLELTGGDSSAVRASDGTGRRRAEAGSNQQSVRQGIVVPESTVSAVVR